MNKVVSVEDLINLLESLKASIKANTKRVLTPEQKKDIISQAMNKGDPKEKLLAAHQTMESLKVEFNTQGKLEVIDWLLETLHEKSKDV